MSHLSALRIRITHNAKLWTKSSIKAFQLVQRQFIFDHVGFLQCKGPENLTEGVVTIEKVPVETVQVQAWEENSPNPKISFF